MIYTIPALNAVDFGLTEYTAPSLAKHESGLTSYSVPVLSSVDFALTVYTLPSSATLRGRVNFELLAITVSASGFSNTSSFGADSVKFTYTPSAFANSNSFGTAELTQVTSTIDLTADGVLNVNYFGSGLVSAQGSQQQIIGGGTWFASRKPAVKRLVKLSAISIENKQLFGDPYISRHETISLKSVGNITTFGSHGCLISYEREDEEIIILMLAA